MMRFWLLSFVALAGLAASLNSALAQGTPPAQAPAAQAPAAQPPTVRPTGSAGIAFFLKEQKLFFGLNDSAIAAATPREFDSGKDCKAAEFEWTGLPGKPKAKVTVHAAVGDKCIEFSNLDSPDVQKARAIAVEAYGDKGRTVRSTNPARPLASRSTPPGCHISITGANVGQDELEKALTGIDMAAFTTLCAEVAKGK